MSNRRTSTLQRRNRLPRCARCHDQVAEHVLVMPPRFAGEEGYELLACSGCWPALKAAATALGARIEGCDCGDC